jgi:hypothetical protein
MGNFAGGTNQGTRIRNHRILFPCDFPLCPVNGKLVFCLHGFPRLHKLLDQDICLRLTWLLVDGRESFQGAPSPAGLAVSASKEKTFPAQLRRECFWT